MEKFKAWFMGKSKNFRLFLIAVVVFVVLGLVFKNSEADVEAYSWMTFNPGYPVWLVIDETGSQIVCTLGGLNEGNKNDARVVLQCAGVNEVDWADCRGEDTGVLHCDRDILRQ